MALFNYPADIKQYVSGATANFSIDTLTSYIDSSVEEYLVPLFGLTFCNKVIDETITAPEVLEPFKRAVANLSFVKYADDGTLEISDAGITRIDNGTSKSAYQWQVRNFKKARLDVAGPAVYNLYLYLEANLSLYTDYRDSTERAMWVGVPIRGFLLFSSCQQIDGFWTYIALVPQIRKAKDDLDCLITPEITNSIISNILAQSISTENAKILNYVEQFIAAQTILLTCKGGGVNIGKKGLFLLDVESNNGNDQTNQTDLKAIGMKISAAADEVNKYKTRLIATLDSLATDSVFPSYYTQKLLPKQAISTDQSNLKTFLL